MQDQFDVLARRLSKVRGGGSGRGIRYPALLRAEAAELGRLAQSGGEPLSRVAKRLSLAPATLERWMQDEPKAHSGFRRVELAEVCSPEAAGPGSVSLVTPRGYRLEGLSAAQALELLGRLDAGQ